MYIGLTDSADLLVHRRETPWYGHGRSVADDLFTRAGRASWLLREVTGRADAPVLRRGTDGLLLRDMVRDWKTWFQALDNGAACFPSR